MQGLDVYKKILSLLIFFQTQELPIPIAGHIHTYFTYFQILRWNDFLAKSKTKLIILHIIIFIIFLHISCFILFCARCTSLIQ